MNDIYRSYIMNPVNGLMQDSVTYLDSQWMLWVSLFLLSISLLLNYYLYIFLKYNKSVMQVISSNAMLTKTPSKSSLRGKSQNQNQNQNLCTKEVFINKTQLKSKVNMPFFGELKGLADEKILEFLEDGRLQSQNLEASLEDFERAVLIRRLHAGKQTRVLIYMIDIFDI
jgi:hypothetical protein